MRSARRKGFLLLYVLVLIALLAAGMILLTDASGSMAHETRRRYLQACERNLMASGLAWTARNGVPRGGSKALDVSSLDVPEARLQIEPAGEGEDAGMLRLRISCGRGRHVLRSTKTCRVPRGTVP